MDDGPELAAALGAHLDALTFTGLGADQVTALVIDEIAGWAGARGWRVYRRAPSVMSLPPPLDRQRSVLDVACARPGGALPIAIEVDHTDRRRTVDKLLAEAAAGRVALWVRWSAGQIRDPGPPVHLVPLAVTRPRPGVFARGADRPPPPHSAAGGSGTPQEFPL
ncbi:hypothetical protein [Catenuloplanes atrovinosus]|uniref:Uncharacterized protein n=1 Tax=Catenuloplanes atrovinosus TaxID=137266 RepID=A0AAE3YKU0_9ACTN|nr:hypothetical protein [Catenuloplanes atrovinosus]MDR7273651.1 hypothetical protein [Catenuloplanes atrovinosus]